MIVAKMRAYGNFPAMDKLPDDILLPHLESAKREIARKLPDASLTDPDYIDLVLCQAVINALPAANSMTSEGISDYSESGINRRWLTPNEVIQLIALYEKRKAELFAILKPADETPENLFYGEL